MLPRGGFDTKATQLRLCGTEATPDAIVGLAHADPAKALVMKYVGQLVTDGYAEWKLLANGEIELRFDTGETFILRDKVIVRIA
jgi:hypothetical protein